MKFYESTEAENIKINWDRFDEEVQTGVALCKLIEEEGYEAYIVGGCVRDIVLWYESGAEGDPEVHDVDIATNMPMDELYKCKKFRCTSNNGEAHGTIVVLYGGYSYEVTQFRADGDYSDGRHPDSVSFTNSFEEDTKRRDFTINAMGIDCDGNVIDYHNGVEDLLYKVLRTVGDPKERFSEDALRIIRAMRFAARFDMDIDDDTMEAISELSHTLSKVARERIGAELIKTSEYGHTAFARVISLLVESGATAAIDPSGMIDWENAVELTRKNTMDDKEIMLACLFDNIDVKDLKRAIDMFRLDNETLKTLTFIYSNEQAVRRPEDSLVKTVKAITNKDFIHLYAFYCVKTAIVISWPEVEKLKTLASKVVPVSKDITKAVSAAGYSGPEFGKVLNATNEWYYKETYNGKQPTNVEVVEFIENM